MPIDPSVLGGQRPIEPMNPFAIQDRVQQQRAQQIQQGQAERINQQRIADNDLALGAQRQKASEVEATRAAIKGAMEPDPKLGLPRVNYEKAASLLHAQGFTEAASSLMDAATKTATGRAQLQETMLKIREHGQAQIGQLAQNMQMALKAGADPAALRSRLIGHLAVAAGDGLTTEEQAQELEQQIGNAPLEQWGAILETFIPESMRVAQQTAEAGLKKTKAEAGIAEANAARGGLTADQLAQQTERATDNERQAAAQRSTEQYQQGMLGVARQNAAQGRADKERPVGGATDVKDAVAAMKEGTVPPILPGRASKDYVALLAESRRQGYDLAQAATDWQATQKHVATLNGAQQTRMAQAIDNAAHSLDVIDDLATQWDGGKFPLLNKGQLALAKQGVLGPKAQQIATQLEAQISDVTSELGNVYMGGNSPTDHSLTLAAKNLSADWTKDQLKSALKLARTNLTIRQNSMRNVGVAGASATNPYAPPQASGKIQARDPQGKLHEAEPGTPLPEGWKIEGQK